MLCENKVKREKMSRKKPLGVSFAKNLCIPANQKETDVRRDMKTRENMMKRTEGDEEEEDTETGNQSVVASV